jgi:hypothetical protein
MNYIQLARQLDIAARNANYNHFPDDCLSLILDYSGNINQQPKNIFLITFKYSNVKDSDYINLFAQHQNDEKKLKKCFSDCKNICSGKVYYCDCCRRFFKNNPKNHDKTKTHLNSNKRKRKLSRIYKKSWDYYRDMLNKDTIGRWGYIPINPQGYKIYDLGFCKG